MIPDKYIVVKSGVQVAGKASYETALAYASELAEVHPDTQYRVYQCLTIVENTTTIIRQLTMEQL